MTWPNTSTVNAIDISTILERTITGFDLTQVKGAMDRAYDHAEFAGAGLGDQLVAKVEGWYAKVINYDALIDAGAPNAGLKKADVLEWFGDAGTSGQLAGLREERKRYYRWIAATLGLVSQRTEGRVIRT